MHTLAGTRQALADLMSWHGIEEQGEAMTLMIHHLHGLGPAGSAPFFATPRHETRLSKSVLQDFRMQSLLMIRKDGGASGVHYDRRTGEWIASIRFGGKLIRIGSYGLKFFAKQARREAEKKYGYHENHGKR